MQLVVLYLGIAAIGYFVGSKLRKQEKKISWTGKAQLISIIALVFMMGGRIGADESVVSSLGTIGLTSLVLTLFAFTGSVAFCFGTRKLLKINKEGGRDDD